MVNGVTNQYSTTEMLDEVSERPEGVKVKLERQQGERPGTRAPVNATSPVIR